MTNFKISILFS